MRLLGSDRNASALSLHLTLPPSYLFKFPPASLPEAVPPPRADYGLARPFNIDPALYNRLLSVNWPITVALVYATTVWCLNRLNKQRNHKPWAISKSLPFFTFVLLHNIFLALYSAWTFVGMINAARRSWPDMYGPPGVVEMVDAMCKINGPRGVGSAVSFNQSTSAWNVTNRAVRLANGLPDNSDVGRLWNEGLSFYGWLFYLSKLYEILDTFIILAKGRDTSLLQTYHHTGAMFCMWAGIRYMSPPIWLFVTINSFIHALMYTYYAISALSIPVPGMVKRILTTLQIAQFVVGFTYAAAHLFISYSIPVSVPYLFWHNSSTAIHSATSSVATTIATAGVGSWVKKIALRAAGSEGLAENVHNSQGQTFGIDALHAADLDRRTQEIRYRTEYPIVHCLDTSGQAFATYFNLIYLAPLTYLFVNFFIRSYIHRTSDRNTHPTKANAVGKSAHDATHGLERRVQEAMTEDQGQSSLPEDIDAKIKMTKAKLEEGYEEISQYLQNAPDGFQARLGDTKLKLEEYYDDLIKGVQEKKEQVKDKSKSISHVAQNKGRDYVDKAKKLGEYVKENAEDKSKGLGNEARDKGKDYADKVRELGEDVKGKVEDKSKSIGNEAKDKGRAYVAKARELGEDVEGKVEDKSKSIGNKAKEKSRAYADKSRKLGEDIEEKAEDAGKSIGNDAKDKGRAYANEAKNFGENVNNAAKDKTTSVSRDAKAKGTDAADKAQNLEEDSKEKVSEASEKSTAKVKEGMSYAKVVGAKLNEEAGSKIESGAEEVQNGAEEMSQNVEDGVSSVKEAAGEENPKIQGDSASNAELAPQSSASEEATAPRPPHQPASTRDFTKPSDNDGNISPTNKPHSPDTAESAYEVSIDEVTSKEEKEAEAEMQPEGESARNGTQAPTDGEHISPEYNAESSFGEDSGYQVSKEEATDGDGEVNLEDKEVLPQFRPEQ